MNRSCLALAVLVVLTLGTRTVCAQCGAKPSSCTACHDGTRAPRPAAAPWHEDHGFADLCSSCHGGRPEAEDVATAHQGLVEPLGVGSPCSSCHAASSEAFRVRYVTALNEASRPAPIAPKPNPHGDPTRNLIVAAFMTAFAVVGGLLVVRREKKWSA